MSRNKVVVYKESTDLRGKRVELRSGEVVEIPKDAIRTPQSYHVWYSADHGELCVFQNFDSRNSSRHEHDIMKVLK